MRKALKMEVSEEAEGKKKKRQKIIRDVGDVEECFWLISSKICKHLRRVNNAETESQKAHHFMKHVAAMTQSRATCRLMTQSIERCSELQSSLSPSHVRPLLSRSSNDGSIALHVSSLLCLGHVS